MGVGAAGVLTGDARFRKGPELLADCLRQALGDAKARLAWLSVIGVKIGPR